jgi:hypothetical protein
LRETLIGRLGADDEQIVPGPRSYDGTYTELKLSYRGVEVRVQTAAQDDSWAALVTPLAMQKAPAWLVVEAGLLWNRPGCVGRTAKGLVIDTPTRKVLVRSLPAHLEDAVVATHSPYLVLPLDKPVVLSTGQWPADTDAIGKLMQERRAQRVAGGAGRKDLASCHEAIQTCLAWDTIYEPTGRRVISPVSRLWNCTWGGYVMFCWDSYFAALLAAPDHKDLACANAVEVTRGRAPAGFVPNFASTDDCPSSDRSQPPVGSMVVLDLYRRFQNRWLLEETYPTLLTWNRWWHQRRVRDGYLVWGSDPFEPRYGRSFEVRDVNNWQAAAFESGLDNSPMYDGIPYDAQAHHLLLADVGLQSLYIMDCRCLAEIAETLGRAAEAAELRQRAEDFAHSLETLWDEPTGLYLNKRLDNGAMQHRLSPCHFYPLLARVPSPLRARRMVQEHLLNPREFAGPWMLPSIARNDPAFADQQYWRGRVWAPMNYLVYRGLAQYDLPEARKLLAERSADLLLREWLAEGHVHENYNALTGDGDDVRQSDRFYHWGGLLGLAAMEEAGRAGL